MTELVGDVLIAVCYFGLAYLGLVCLSYLVMLAGTFWVTKDQEDEP